MDMPNSPVELMQRCLLEQLDCFPEGSTVQMPIASLRELYSNYKNCLDVIRDQQELINAFIENS